MAGIYFHIPFCKQACSYCDFHFSTTFHSYRDQLIHALMDELVSRKDELKEERVETIYFGGGTPSLLSIEEIKRLMKCVQDYFDLYTTLEITLEANPDDISFDRLFQWKAAGINRLSIGVQSFLSEDLKWMNRAHDVQQAHTALTLVKEIGFEMSMDLIYGLPSATMQQWELNLNAALRYNPEHISAYCLTVEKKTALYQWVKTRSISLASEDEQSSQFEFLIETLRNRGYEQYEISNFCRDEKYAQHNANYWKGAPYLGIGPSAHSFIGKTRRWNVSNNNQYIKGVTNNTVYFEQEHLRPEDQFNEYILTGLRTKWGIDMDHLVKIANVTAEFRSALQGFIDSGDLMMENNQLFLTDQGKLLADHVASELFLT